MRMNENNNNWKNNYGTALHFSRKSWLRRKKLTRTTFEPTILKFTASAARTDPKRMRRTCSGFVYYDTQKKEAEVHLQWRSLDPSESKKQEAFAMLMVMVGEEVGWEDEMNFCAVADLVPYFIPRIYANPGGILYVRENSFFRRNYLCPPHASPITLSLASRQKSKFSHHIYYVP